MIKKRILLFGYSDLGHASLKFLLENGEEVAGVFTHEDAARENIWFPSVKELALANKIPVYTPSVLSSGEVQIIKGLKPDLIFSFYYRNLIPNSILSLAPLGAYNMHGSLLPKYRGRAPVNWAVLKGEAETGATLHVMTDKPDAGDIVDQEAVPIGPDETSSEVQKKVTQAAVRVMERQIEALKMGTARFRPQIHSLSTYYGRRRPEDGKIDWSKPAREIHNLIRAVTHPYPGAFTDNLAKITYIWRSRPTGIKAPPNSQLGQILDLDGSPCFVCGDGQLLEALNIQGEGEGEVDGKEFLRRNKKLEIQKGK